jgi:hypothetical protein
MSKKADATSNGLNQIAGVLDALGNDEEITLGEGNQIETRGVSRLSRSNQCAAHLTRLQRDILQAHRTGPLTRYLVDRDGDRVTGGLLYVM